MLITCSDRVAAQSVGSEISHDLVLIRGIVVVFHLFQAVSRQCGSGEPFGQ